MSLFEKIFGRKELPATIAPTPPAPKPGPTYIAEMTPAELAAGVKAGQAIAIVDLRQPWEYGGGHIAGAINIPLPQLPLKLHEIPKDTRVVLQCYHGITSLDAAGYLIQNGWPPERVFSLSGGIAGWAMSQGMAALTRKG